MQATESKQSAYIKTLTICLIIAVYTFCFYYFSLQHHRWFDETQAWLIAQNNSWSTLWRALSFEGHPILWYAIIYFPSKLWSFSVLSVLSTSIFFVSCFYVFFKSPFPMVFKILLPLNYYFFYI